LHFTEETRGTMKACAACGIEVEESDLFMSDKGEVCASCDLDDEIGSKGLMLGPLTITALVCAIGPFFFSISSSSSSASGYTYIDYVALPGGAGALLIGVAALATAKKSGGDQMRNFAASAGAIALGVIQVLRGFGKF
jgi:hypothetical protein